MAGLKRGSLTKLVYEGREFEAIVIDPDGLGSGQPSVGFGFRMAERNVGIPESTLRSWVRDSEGEISLELPSGKVLRVRDILGSDGNSYSVIEASDWFTLAIDLLLNPGRTGKGLRSKLGDFIGWFAIKGFYAEAYVALKGVYDAKDSRATTKWMESRQLGIPARKLYTDLLQSQGCAAFDYANWTNRVYQGLFGMPAKEMKEVWDLMAGNKSIARNYVPEAEGLDAVRYCEDMVVRMFVDDLAEAHDMAIGIAKRKFDLNFEQGS
jgi:hypothetical protein